ncbi:MAG TPA: hypothetical protein VGN20_07585 [Mucilaginibacter sp.]|jgi:hypothetical protein
MRTKIDPSKFKLGKSLPVHDPRTLQLANYLESTVLPPAPVQCSYTGSIGDNAWGMMNNDKIGDCTCAAAGHLIMEWTNANGALFTPADQDIVKAYAEITGYDPKTGLNDNGANERDVLNYWRKTGIAGHQILAYAALEPKNNTYVKQSVYLFGGCYIGVSLPISCQTQTVWSVPPQGATGTGAPGSWGGHAVCVVGYDTLGLTVITWGATKQMTWSFWNTYCDESYAIISTDFAGEKPAPNGFDLAALEADLKAVAHPA